MIRRDYILRMVEEFVQALQNSLTSFKEPPGEQVRSPNRPYLNRQVIRALSRS